MSSQLTEKIYVPEIKLGTSPTSPENSPVGPAPEAMGMNTLDGSQCETLSLQESHVGNCSLTTYNLASSDQATCTLTSGNLASCGVVSPFDTDACSMGICDVGTCDMGPCVMGTCDVEGCKLVPCNLPSCNMANCDVPTCDLVQCGKNGFLPSTVTSVPNVEASAGTSSAGGSSMEGPEQIEVPVLEPGHLKGFVLEPEELERLLLQPGRMRAFLVNPGQLEGHVLQPGQMKGTVLEAWQMKVPVLEPKELEGLVVEPGYLEAFVLDPGQLEGPLMQPGEIKSILLKPGQQEGLMRQPEHQDSLVLQPGQQEGLVLQPRHQEGLVLRPGHQEGLVLQPGHQEGPVPQHDFPQQQGAKRKIPVRRNPKNRSLMYLTQRFVELFKSAPQGLLNLNNVSVRLNAQKRRLYDITNVLDGVGFLEKRTKSVVQWVGPDLRFLETPKLISQLAELESTEKHLDELITNTKENLASITDNPENQQLAYVNFQDIQSVQSCSKQFVIVVKAPEDTQMEVPAPGTNATSIYLKSGKGPIEAYYYKEEK